MYFFYKKYFFAEQAELWPIILRELLFRLFLLAVENQEIFLAPERVQLRWHMPNTNGSCYARFLLRKLPNTVLLRTAAHDFLPNLRVTHEIFFPLEQGPATALCQLKDPPPNKKAGSAEKSCVILFSPSVQRVSYKLVRSAARKTHKAS